MDALLLQVIAALCALGALAWLCLAYPLRIAALACKYFALANLLLLLSLVATLQRGTQSDWWAWAAADLLGLAALTALRRGVRRLWRQAQTPKLEWALLLLAVSGYLSATPGPESLRLYTALYSGFAALLCAAVAIDLWRATRAAFEGWAALTLALPFGLAAVLMAARLFDLPGAQAPATLPDEMALHWAFLLLTVLLNASLFGAVLSRLVLEMRRQAERDHLTGLFNRRSLEQRIAQEQARHRRHPQPFALVMLDIDHFKGINDARGHDAGDAALRHLAQVLLPLLRQTDVLGRFGGEEFMVLMPLTDQDQALLAAERMRVALTRQPLRWQGQELPITASFGVADSRHGELMLRHVDAALYRAKANGRNCVEMA